MADDQAPSTADESDRNPAPRGIGTFLLELARDWGMALGVVVVVFVLWSIFTAPRTPSGSAPDFTLTDLQGDLVTLSEVQSELVVLNFWFTTCPPCRAEIPELSAFAAAHPDVALYGVSTDLGMPRARLRRESENLGIEYPVVHDLHGDVAARYGVNVFPTTVVLRDMEVVTARVGAVDRATLESMLGEHEH